jgi:autotransporter family porin
VKRIAAIGCVILAVAIAPVTRAQYTADFQTNIISGVTSNWVGDYYVGYTNFADVLLIQNSGVLSNSQGILETSSNSVVVTGTGSVWSSSVGLMIGVAGSGNSMVVKDGGRVTSSWPSVGYQGGKNAVLVTDSGSVWSNAGTLTLGWYEPGGNSLVISNGGQVFSTAAIMGLYGGSNNSVLVTGSGSVWSNSGTLEVGHYGPLNKVAITDGGKVFTKYGVVGGNSESNSASVSGFGSIWVNSGTLAVADSYLVITNGGQVLCGDGYLAAFPPNNVFNLYVVSDFRTSRNSE